MNLIEDIKKQGFLVLAPMAAINCTAFRMLCKENGASLIYTQMINCDLMKDKTTNELKNFINIKDCERPVVVQLIGSDVKNILNVAKKVENIADLIDLNMGCVLDDYVNKGSGAALLNDLDKVEEIIKALKSNVNKPISAKIRIGWDSQTINAVKVVRLLEKCGVDLVCIHGRTYEQKYSGKINWSLIKQVKELVNVPIIANGNVESYELGLDLKQKTGADFVMIGRCAKHSPWVFNKDFIKNNQNVKKQILRFIELYLIHENRQSVNELREHVFWMLKDYKTKINMKVVHTLKSIKEIENFIKNLN